MKLGLTGRIAVVTGAGTGIGRAIANAFAAEGASVIGLGRHIDGLEETIEALPPPTGPAHAALVADLSQPDSLEAVCHDILAQGGAHILVNNACSAAALKKVHEMDPRQWDDFVTTNLGGVYHLCRLLLPAMIEQGWGRIVTIGSLTSELGSSHYPEYAAVKAGLVGLTRNLAVDYGRHGITANLVQPGFIGSERFEAAAPAKLRQAFLNATSLKRIGSPEEVASVVVFLASEQASYVTGAVVPVGGGAGLNNLW